MSSQGNNLNFVVLEGRLVVKPIIKNDKCEFSIVNEIPVYNNKSDEYIYEKNIFEIHVNGKTGKRCFDNLNIGNTVKLRGMLKNSNNIFILADHVEFIEL